jgi:hypothetical protein
VGSARKKDETVQLQASAGAWQQPQRPNAGGTKRAEEFEVRIETNPAVRTQLTGRRHKLKRALRESLLIIKSE